MILDGSTKQIMRFMGGNSTHENHHLRRRFIMNRYIKKIAVTFILIFIAGLAFGLTAQAKGKVTKVQIIAPTKKNRYVITRKNANVKVQLNVKVTAKGGASKAVKYKSSNKKVVSVSSAGMLTAKKKGTATSTVISKTNKKKKDKLKIIVKQTVRGVNASVLRPLASYNNVVSLVRGRTYTIQTKISPSNASNKKVSYISSKKSVASVTSKGKITAKKAGTTKITLTSKDGSKKKTSFTVYVTNRIIKRITSLKASSDKKILAVGESAFIKAAVEPYDATMQKMVYKSSNSNVAAVDAVTGKVTAVAPGNAKITVRAMDGSKKTATVKIQVAQLYTAIAPVNGVTADVTVSFDGDRERAATDVSRLILAATKAGDKKSIIVNGNKGVIENKNGKEIYVGNVPLLEYIKDNTAKDGEVIVTYGANISKAVAALELAKFTAVGEYQYTIKIDDYVFTSLSVSAKGICIKAGGQQYDALIRELQNRKYAVVSTVRR